MADFNPNPYRGEASIPHVSEEFFKVYFIGAQARVHFSACLHFFRLFCCNPSHPFHGRML